MTESRRSTARVRLLFDEHLSPKVPQALRIIGFNASHIGDGELGIPPRGTNDQSIVEFAKKTSHVLVTSDHGMMRICADQGLQSNSKTCVRAMKTKSIATTATEAIQLAGRRAEIHRKKRQRSTGTKAHPLAAQLPIADEETAP